MQADGDDTSSWVVLGDLKADGTVPLTAPWDVGGFSITNVGALTCDALTSTGINDDATGKRIELTDTAISLGTASTSYFVGRPDDLSSMVYAGSTAANVGGAMTLNGATGSIQFKMDGSNALYNPNNGTGWNFYTEDIATAGIIYSNSLTTGNITASGGISVGSDIYSPDSTGYLRISGGVQDNGATLQLNSSGVGDPYDIIFWTNLGGGFKALKFDSSASTWDFQNNTIVQGVDTVWTGGANTGNKMGTATTNDFGWNDIMGEINVRGIGVTDPTWTQIAATGFWDYKFDIGDSCWINFHIPHDYVPGTPVYLHAHFLTDGTEVRSVKWQFDCVYANGFGQQEFPFATPTTTTAAGDPPGVAYTHMIVEDAGTSVSGMEVDGMLKAKVTRITNGGTDNTDDVFLLTADIHYQSTGLATKNKAPNFYT